MQHDTAAESATGVPSERALQQARAARVEEWASLQAAFAFALSAPNHVPVWLERFEKVAGRIRVLTSEDPDAALYMMLQTATHEVDRYSANHAMFCGVVADLCSTYLDWPPAEADALCNAGLTMNLGMLAMQDSMVKQSGPLSAEQKTEIQDHPAQSVAMLQAAGVADALWLETVRRHHRPVDDGESADPPTQPQRLARLLQRIDVFTAKLSRRKVRPGSNATVAARDACLDVSGLPDETGAALLRVLGLYPPGSFVRMAGGEIGVVVRRGDKAHTPLVACVRRGDGGLHEQPDLRDTSLRPYTVQRSLSADEVRIRLDHQRVIGARPARS